MRIFFFGIRPGIFLHVTPDIKMVCPTTLQSYRLKNLLDLPKRLLFPRAVSSSPTVGLILSSRGPPLKLCDLTLDHLLAKQSLPPLDLSSFEDYLCFQAKSAENLWGT